MELPYYDENGDPIPVEDLPGYLGNTWDGEVFLGTDLGKLTDFDWREYGMLADEFAVIERKLELTLDNKTIIIEAEAWHPHEIIDALPSVNSVYDEPPDQGPAGGSGYIFIAEEGFSVEQILEHSNALYEALVSDLEMIKTKISGTE